jgi:hypothetical protein
MKKIVYLLVALDDHCKVYRLILVASMNETFLKDPKFMLDCSCTARLSPRIEVKSCLQSTDPQEPLFNFLLLILACRLIKIEMARNLHFSASVSFSTY